LKSVTELLKTSYCQDAFVNKKQTSKNLHQLDADPGCCIL